MDRKNFFELNISYNKVGLIFFLKNMLEGLKMHKSLNIEYVEKRFNIDLNDFTNLKYELQKNKYPNTRGQEITNNLFNNNKITQYQRKNLNRIFEGLSKK